MWREGRPGKGWFLCLSAALTGVTARAEDVPSTSIWYRSQEGCPDAAAFLARVEARGIRARIAAVGDAIDFVVTVGGDANQSRGLLERQTKDGTVAVRLLEGGSCEEIVDGMALSLALAHSPESSGKGQPETPVPVPSNTPPKTNEVAETRSLTASSGRIETQPARHPWALGIQGTGSFGIGPDALFGGSAFASYTPGEPRNWAPSFRLAAFGAFGGAENGVHDYRLALFGARLEASLQLGWPAVHVNPLAAVDLGALTAEGTSADGSSDTGFWAALRAGLRSEIALTDVIALEAQLEGIVPFTSYHVRSAQSPQETLYDTAPVGLAVGVGASIRLP
jgi:hypothetical protein